MTVFIEGFLEVWPTMFELGEITAILIMIVILSAIFAVLLKYLSK